MYRREAAWNATGVACAKRFPWRRTGRSWYTERHLSSRRHRRTGRRRRPPLNAAAFLSKAARIYGSRNALRFGRRRLDYRELDAQASRLASALLARGLVRGDRVAIFMRNNPEYAVALFGVLRAGLVVVPVNAKLHARELAFILENAECAGLVFGDEHAPDVEGALAEYRPRLLVRVGADGCGIPFDELLASGDPAFADAEVDPEDLAWLFYTSGTTGFPKGAMLSHRNLVAMTVSCLADVCSFQPEDVVLHAAPLSHGSGLYLLAMVARGSGNLIYHRSHFDAADVLATVERERVTVLGFVAPTMIVMLLDAPGEHDTSSLRRIVYGGAPIHAEHAREAGRRFGPVLCQIYGQGEAPMTISYLRPADHTLAPDAEIVPAGIPRSDVELRLVGDDGSEVPAGHEGEVAVRGDVVMAGYWRNQEATARSLRGGWLYTGDIGRLDERGFLLLLDRKHDMIISGGSNIYPREVEEALTQHAAVREACVFGMPDRLWGESVAAAVVVRAGAAVTADELVDHCRAVLAGFKKPKAVHFVDELPKNAYGKVLRRELRERFAGEASP